MKKTLFVMTASLFLTQVAFSAVTNTTNPHPNVHQVNATLKSEYQQVLNGVKSGKLTTDQGASLKTQLKNVRLQEVAFLKQNGNHELTVAQTSQLTASLETIEQTLTTAGVPPAPTPTGHR